MNKKHAGRVCTVCPECGKRQWVEVTFPNFQERFEDTTFHCGKCGIELELTDPHNSMNTETLSIETGIQKRIPVSFFFLFHFSNEY